MSLTQDVVIADLKILGFPRMNGILWHFLSREAVIELSSVMCFFVSVTCSNIMYF